MQRTKVVPMDFQNVNPLNVRLNLVSGNLMPMTADDDTPFPIFWKMCCVLGWLLELLQSCVLLPGCLSVPKEKALKDGLIGIVVFMEVIFIVTRMHIHRKLIRQLIGELNAFMSLEDEIMRDIVKATLKSMEIPLKFYWAAGSMSIIVWSSMSFFLIFEKDRFYYVDFRMPVVYGKEPVSIGLFVVGSIVVTISSVYIFTKKVSMDSYMIHLVLLVTAQYRYVASKLSVIIQNHCSQSNPDGPNKERFSGTDEYAEKQMKTLCQRHSAIVHTTALLRDLMAINCSIIYVNSLFWFCSILIMVLAMPSTDSLEKAVILLYACGGVVELYLLCSCVQQLLDASVEITDRAFHDEWYRFGAPMKRLFMFMIMANNLPCKLSTFEDTNLSLPSFMTIINQAYSIALLFLRTN